jgi:hypothetical protein
MIKLDFSKAKDRQLALDRLKSLVAAIESGSAELCDHSYSTTNNFTEYHFTFGIRLIEGDDSEISNSA